MSVDENIKHQGTLEKQCKVKTWSWKKYWFVLFNEQLCYYKEQDGSKSSGRRLSSNELGEIDLSQAHAVKELKNVNRGFSFEILTKSRNYILSADKEESRAQWVKLLTQAMTVSMAKRRNSSIRSIRTSCNSIDEAEDTYADIHFGSRPNSGSHTLPAKLPSTSRPPSTITGSIREETEDDLYTDIATTEADSAFFEDSDQVIQDRGSSGYDYTVAMRKKSWKFNKQRPVDEDGEMDGEYDDTYAEVEYDSIHEDTFNGTSQQHNSTANSSAARSPAVNSPAAHNPAAVRSSNPTPHATAKRVCSQPLDESKMPHYSAVIPRAQRNADLSKQTSHGLTSSTDESKLPEYAAVIPKAQRNKACKVSSMIENQNPNRSQDDDYVYIRDVNSNENKHQSAYKTRSLLNFPDVKPLPHPRMEYTDRSHFDDIRLFLSRNRGMNEIFKDPPQEVLGGKSIDVLANFLSSINTSNSQEDIVESTRL